MLHNIHVLKIHDARLVITLKQNNNRSWRCFKACPYVGRTIGQ